MASPQRKGAGGDDRRTDATLVAERLREDIVRGVVAPATRLRLAPLAERYGIGRGPLREAASRLAAEQLVVFEDRRGFSVAPISRGDLVDVTRTRQRIETMALRDAIEAGDEAWEAAVVAAHHLLAKTSNLDDSDAGRDAFTARHRALHAALCAACPSSYLLEFRRTLYAHTERYRALAEHRYRQAAVAPRDVPAEHAALVEAALARDADRACAILEAHIRRTADTLIESYPALFGADGEPSP